ncbi:Putative V-type Na+-ATPase subunit J [Streptococcus equi subsp. zooepidemicus ATCC 35246]|nr:Putative V-type Na+-ATPase subunit J [Streptococcus equi subsp. zooepidemicus ATCC 35246]
MDNKRLPIKMTIAKLKVSRWVTDKDLKNERFMIPPNNISYYHIKNTLKKLSSNLALD